MDDPLAIPARSLPASQACAEPKAITRARAVDFGTSITGYLCHASIDLHLRCLVGIVYGESRGRFADGASIRSSMLEGRWEQEGYSLYRTLNGSTYVICDWAPLELNARFTSYSG